MAEISNYSWTRYEDGVLTVTMTPPVEIGGLEIRWGLSKRFGSEDFTVTKYMASGYSNTSGITMLDSGLGRFNVAINSVDTSGLDFGNYSTRAEILTSGRRKVVTEGYMILKP